MLQRDSLKMQVEDNRQKVRQYKEMVNGGWEELRSGKQLNNKLQQYGMQHMPVPGILSLVNGHTVILVSVEVLPITVNLLPGT